MSKIYQELRLLREENLKLFNELAKHHQILLNGINYGTGKNLRHSLDEIASEQTSEFIIKHMPTVKAFENKDDLLKHALQESKIEGLLCEFGVYKGSTINMIAELKPNNTIYGFDSFEGLPEDWRSGFYRSTFNVNGNLPSVKQNVELIKGWFDESLPKFLKTHNEPCSFIHIDCDLYSSTKTIFLLLKDQIVKGTIILFDEYFNYPTWQKCEYKAFNEFVQYNNLDFEYIGYSMHEQVAVKIK